MRAPLHIYRENALRVFPTSSQASQQFEAVDSEPEYFDAFSRDYVDLYVDTGVPELLLYLRLTTTLLPGRKDNAFFHYRPESDGDLLEEFARILELNRQETLGSGATDTTEAARRSALPSALVESGLFEEGWSFDRSNADGEVAELVGRVEPELPGLDELERETFLSLAEGQSQPMRFGVGSVEDGVQVVQYLVESDIDIRIALSSTSAPADLPVDVLLVSGHEGFIPLDDTTAQAFRQQLDEHKQEWQQRRTDRSHELVDELVGLTDTSDRPNHAIHNDLAALVRYVDYGGDVSLRAQQAQEIRDHYDTLVSDRHLEDKSAVIDELRERLVDERDTLREEIQDDRLDHFEELLESLEDSVRNNRKQYYQLGLVAEILSRSETASGTTHRRADWSELTGTADVEPHRLTKTFREQWHEFLANDHLDDEIQAFVRETLQKNVDDRRNRLATSIIKETTERFKQKLSNIADKARSEFGRELAVYRAFSEIKQTLDNGDHHCLEDVHRVARPFLEDWKEFAESDHLDESIVDGVRKQVVSIVEDKKDNLERHLKNKTKEICQEAVVHVLNQTDDSGQRLANAKQFRSALDSPDTLQPGRDPTLKDAKKLFERLDTDLKQEALRNSLRDTARHALSDGLSKAYFELINVLVQGYCDQIGPENSERAIEFLDEVETVNTTAQIHGTLEFSDEARQALTALEEAHSNTNMTSDHREWIETEVSDMVSELKTELEDNQEQQYEKEINRILSRIDEVHRHQYEVQLEIYKEIEEIIENDAKSSYEYEYSPSRNFKNTWSEILRDQAVTYEWRKSKEEELNETLTNKKRETQCMLNRGKSEPSGTAIDLPHRRVVGGAVVGLVLGLLIGTIAATLVGVPFSGLDDGSGPELELETPEMGEHVDEEGVTVRGTASADYVDLRFESRNTAQEFSKTTPVDDGEFEKFVEDIPIDRYRLVVTTNQTASDIDGETNETDDGLPGDADTDDDESGDGDQATATHIGFTENETESSEEEEESRNDVNEEVPVDETTETTVFTYLGDGAAFDITDIETDSSGLTVDADILRNVSSATVRVYNRVGAEITNNSVALDGQQNSHMFNVPVEDSGMHNVRIEPTHVSDPDLVDQQIVDVPGFFDVRIQNTSEPEAGDPLEVEVVIENTGGASDEQSISVDAQLLGEETKDVGVAGGDVAVETFSFETEMNERGRYNVTAASEDTDDERTVTILGPSFDVSVEDTNAPVTEGEPLNVNVDVENTGEIEGTQSVALNVGRLGETGTEVSLDSGNDTHETFTLETGEGDAGEYESTVVSDDDDDSVNITVEADDTMGSLALGPAIPAGPTSTR